MMVQEQYAPHLENMYCDILPWKGDSHDIQGAIIEASKVGKPLCTQVLGPPDTVRQFTYEPAGLQNAVCTSFQKEAWRVAGRLKEWDDCLPLVFDKRDAAREAHILSPLAERKKFILVSADGISSPFPYKSLLMELLKVLHVHIVNLSTIKPIRFYDLLALYERAHCLVAIDSAPLHLSRATPDLPVVALANDKPILWAGASWRPNHVFYCRYSDFPYRAAEMIEAMRALKPGARTVNPVIFHVWNAYESDHCDSPAGWYKTPIQVGSCGRDSASQLKDPKRFPFLRDSLRMGLQRARDTDWVCLTKPEITFAQDATATLMKQHASFAYRIANGSYTPIGDLFCARKDWWKSIIHEIPDFVFGKDHYWTMALLALFRKHGAVDVTGCCFKDK